MASNVTRDHHNLRRNLNLNGNYISNDGGDEGIRIDDAGNVGIGTDDPDGKLHVQTASANSAKEVFANDLIVEGTNATGITISTSNSQDKYLVFGTYNDADVGWIKYDGSDNMTFKVNDTEDVLYLKSDGNVGIGNSAPVSALDVRGPVGTGAGSAGVLTLTTKEVTIVANDQLGRIDFQAPLENTGGTTGDQRLVGASIHAVAAEGFAVDNNSTALVFSTGTTTAPIERMRIDQDGLVGLHTAGAAAGAIHAFGSTDYTLKSWSDTNDYFKISIGGLGVTTISTVDDGGNNQAKMAFQPQGDLTFTPAANHDLKAIITTKTASSTLDSTFRLTEVLNLSSGDAGGSDVHHGIWYTQTQTDLAGWNSTYLMYLDGGNKFTVDDKAQLLIDINDISTSNNTNKGIYIDIDSTGTLDTSQTNTNIGIDLDINRDSGTGHATSTTNTTGIDIDLVGHASGTTTNTGINIAVSAADTNYALITSGGNVGIGVADPDSLLEVFGESAQLKLSWDDSNHAAITVADDGHLEIATTGTDADLTLDSASGIMLETTALYIYPSAASTQSFYFNMSGDPKFTINSEDHASDEFSIQVNDAGATTLTTVDHDGADAHLTLDADGEIILVPGRHVTIDRDYTDTTATLTTKALHVDLDRTGTVSTGTDYATGIYVDVTQTGASGGVIISTGLDIDVVGDAGGTSFARGITIDVSGADTCTGIFINSKDGGIDFKNVSSAYSLDYFSINTIEDGETTLTTIEAGGGSTAHLNMVPDGDFNVDAVGDITLDAYGKQIYFAYNGTSFVSFDMNTHDFKFMAQANQNDYFNINVGAEGATTLSTVDADSAVAHLSIVAAGNVNLDAAGNIKLDADGGDISFFDNDTNRLRFTNSSGSWTIRNGTSDADTIFSISDGGVNTEVMRLDGSESSLLIASGKKIEFGDAGENISGDGTNLTIVSGGHVEFDNCAVGFDRLEAPFSTTAVIESGGSDDTDIDFRLSNKYRLEMANDIAQMNLIFPNTSGNFLLVCHILGSGGGDHDVTAWKVWEHDSAAGATNAAATTDVMWAGGSVPAFTSSGIDIVSFYWDADEQQCYGVASLAFATP